MANNTGKDDIRNNINSLSYKLADIAIAGMAGISESISDQHSRESLNPCGQDIKKTVTTGLTKLHRFTRIEHTLFSLPLIFSGAWLGFWGKFPSWRVLGLIALACVGARTFGMALNRIFDRDIDALNKRTADRELPGGQMSLVKAYMVAFIGFVVYLSACAGLGTICLYLSPIPAIPLIIYSLLKRFTNLCHFGIGLCMALAPLGAFVASSGSLNFNLETILLSIFAFLWISGFDIIYALQDLDADRETGIHSIPASYGSTNAQVIAALIHILATGSIIWLWLLTGCGIISGLTLLIAVGAMVTAYLQNIPLHVRFFPISAIAGIAGSLIPILGELG